LPDAMLLIIQAERYGTQPFSVVQNHHAASVRPKLAIHQLTQASGETIEVNVGRRSYFPLRASDPRCPIRNPSRSSTISVSIRDSACNAVRQDRSQLLTRSDYCSSATGRMVG